MNKFKRFPLESATDEEIVEQMTEMAHFANMRAEQGHKIWVEMDDNAFVIAMAIGLWTLIFSQTIHLSAVRESSLVLVCVVVNGAAWYLQLVGTVKPFSAALLVVGLSAL